MSWTHQGNHTRGLLGIVAQHFSEHFLGKGSSGVIKTDKCGFACPAIGQNQISRLDLYLVDVELVVRSDPQQFCFQLPNAGHISCGRKVLAQHLKVAPIILGAFQESLKVLLVALEHWIVRLVYVPGSCGQVLSIHLAGGLPLHIHVPPQSVGEFVELGHLGDGDLVVEQNVAAKELDVLKLLLQLVHREAFDLTNLLDNDFSMLVVSQDCGQGGQRHTLECLVIFYTTQPAIA